MHQRSLKNFLKNYWGQIYFCICSIFAIRQLINQNYGGHYEIFSSAALNLWKNVNPYPFTYPSGWFIYSPTAGLFFYGPFAALPYPWGLGLLSLMSWGLILFALHRFFKESSLQSSLSTGYREWFYFILSSEIIGALLNVRLEIFFAGAMVLALVWMRKEQKLAHALFLLALVCNFKLQALAPVGLWLTSRAIKDHSLRNIKIFAFWSLIFLIAPWFAYKSSVLELYQDWWTGLSKIDERFWTFQHLYTFFAQNFGLKPPLSITKLTSGAIALSMLIYCSFCAHRDRHLPPNDLRPFALGSAFAVIFSPASQSAGYIFFAPLLLAYFLQTATLPTAQFKKWLMGLALSWALMSLAYSDLVTVAGREWAMDHALKPVGALILLLFYLFFDLKKRVASKGPRPIPYS